jgi:ABC-type dipeptide/oligopeptide/nickel transport system permease component
VLAGQMATPEEIENIRHQLGLDRPIYVQYAVFLGNLSRLDLGRSAPFAQYPVAGSGGHYARLPLWHTCRNHFCCQTLQLD